jgi:XRE family aerobic/anaerobic benzoate catabolism transcriptional regulator
MADAPGGVQAPADKNPFLAALGERVRALRARRGMTRKAVARDADVSERYLSQLETGEGNISIILLRRIASALDVSLLDILSPESEDTVEKRLIRRFLERLPRYLVVRLPRNRHHVKQLLVAISDVPQRRRKVTLAGAWRVGCGVVPMLGCVG